MKRRFKGIILPLALFVLLLVWSIPMSYAAPEGATVTFQYDANRNELQVTINSPTGVGDVELTLDVPQDIDIISFEAAGFLTGAQQEKSDGKHSWYKFPANGEKQGSLKIRVSVSPGTRATVTLETIYLADEQGQAIPLQTPLPISVEVGREDTQEDKEIEDDKSDFTTVTPGKFAVLSPNGGEIIDGSSTYPIKWTVLDNVGRIDLFYSVDGGFKWRQIARRRANTGTYYWHVPNWDVEKCLVRIDAYDAAGNRLTDTSDKPFTVKRSPHGGGVGCR